MSNSQASLLEIPDNDQALLVAIQLTSGVKVDENLAIIEQQFEALRKQYPEKDIVVVLPECCLMFAKRDSDVKAIAEEAGIGPMQQALCQLAEKFKVYLVAGTIAIKAPDGRHFAASLLISPQGKILAQYNKIHLFDVDVADGFGSYRESDNTHPGRDICVVETPIGRIGLAVCYDLRFSALFKAMAEQQADIIVLPSAFTKPTGQAHWELLVRARAVENQCFMIAANQSGLHQNGRETWGHSMIVSPWGEVCDELASGVGFIAAPLNPQLIQECRAKMPMAQQQRFSKSVLSAK
ncbi:carbon-nitrogen hydrolase family protein [Psychrobium sp. 1_MG-2023]|uniref:carbon-nitrogen hydrolase family protein n=1 Tax=Psychrobium sp. 1_MG-2023 TaxID=3062624 RepID=UPI000C34983B|nr:carbon-nitrogen hydrolase family protein [Psychrobium sp. 1_MG-2023]MDP2560715.1 carbon-nitrogen hydrolase family protein [Psychrobium sp. 1_MG-2023]PKF56609.1 amidohydrolase [Alteromonadales bacterium alter-6D02]